MTVSKPEKKFNELYSLNSLPYIELLFQKQKFEQRCFMTNLVVVKNNQVVVSSRQVAEKFGKRHKDVLENIRNILVAENSATKFFQEISHTYRGQSFPEYLMNRDGFTLLAMGFTGKEALQWKMKYIAAFNEMEAQINGKPVSALKAKRGGSAAKQYQSLIGFGVSQDRQKLTSQNIKTFANRKQQRF